MNAFTQTAGDTTIEGSLEVDGGPGTAMIDGGDVGGGEIDGNVKTSGTGTLGNGNFNFRTLTVTGAYDGSAGSVGIGVGGGCSPKSLTWTGRRRSAAHSYYLPSRLRILGRDTRS